MVKGSLQTPKLNNIDKLYSNDFCFCGLRWIYVSWSSGAESGTEKALENILENLNIHKRSIPVYNDKLDMRGTNRGADNWTSGTK